VTKQGDRNESKAKRKDREKLLGATGGKGGSDLVQAGEDAGELLTQLKDHKITIEFHAGGECAHPLISVSAVTFGYAADKVLFRDVSFGIAVDSRIALVGANGTGKSSLLKLITEEVLPLDGSVSTARSVRVGVYSQHSAEQLLADMTPVTYLQMRFPDLNYQQVRKQARTHHAPRATRHALATGLRSSAGA
jgi:ATPase subunit of ABC transporter with duplicated ATPase domains